MARLQRQERLEDKPQRLKAEKELELTLAYVTKATLERDLFLTAFQVKTNQVRDEEEDKINFFLFDKYDQLIII